MSRTGANVPGGLNSTVVPTASPAARPTSAPRNRSRRVIRSACHANMRSDMLRLFGAAPDGYLRYVGRREQQLPPLRWGDRFDLAGVAAGVLVGVALFLVGAS